MKTVGIYTLGCRVNQYESVAIAEALEQRGFSVRKDTEVCDYYIINTCSVTAESQRQSRQTARHFASRGKTAVLGCASQNLKGEFLSIPNVFYVGGCSDKLKVVEAIAQEQTADAVGEMMSAPYETMSVTGRSDLFSSCRAFLKIQDGCNGKCSYCVIPSLRGPSRSRPLEEIIAEAANLAAAGYREVVLTGIELSAYNAAPLSEVIRRLRPLRVAGVERVRLGSLSPGSLTETFLQAAAEAENFMPHVHLSLQSGSDRILRLMRRPYTREKALAGIGLLRTYLPRALVSADFITGFPTEMEEDYLQTESFVKEANLLHVHAFPFSERAGTPAAVMQGALPKEIRKQRCIRLNAVSDSCREQILASFVGKSVRVLVEKLADGIAAGHTEEFLECCFPAETAAVGEIRTVAVVGKSNGRLLGRELCEIAYPTVG